MRIFIVFLLLIEIGYCQDSILVKIDDYVKNMMEKTHTPGLSVAVVKDNEISYVKGFGKIDINSNEKVNENTLFAIGSISKSFTTACLAMLVEKNQIDWDNKVIDYLTEFQLDDPWVTREFTISDLLLHHTGYDQTAFGTLYYGANLSRNDIVSRLKYLKPVSSFRSKVAYQNFTYMIAGLIIEKVTGKSWENFLRENLFTPLEMSRSFAKFEKTRTRKNLSSPHIYRQFYSKS
jgi:CubicO group peptidase (beta-lactamase class C family)